MNGRRRSRRVSEAELALWREVARDAVPLRPRKIEIEQDDDPEAAPRPPVLIKAPRPKTVRTIRPQAPSPSPAAHYQPAAPLVETLSHATPGLDRRTAREMRNGQRRPEARLDLHGKTLDAAHGALERFIIDCSARGMRLVLVVTGKGGDYRERALGAGSDSHRGALRRATPIWLRSPVLAPRVTGVYQAHRRHGGEGALYVYLRKAR